MSVNVLICECCVCARFELNDLFRISIVYCGPVSVDQFLLVLIVFVAANIALVECFAATRKIKMKMQVLVKTSTLNYSELRPSAVTKQTTQRNGLHSLSLSLSVCVCLYFFKRLIANFTRAKKIFQIC